MADLTSFQVTDDVTDNLAEYHNRLLGGTLRAEFVNTETISATKELADADCQYQVITASGATRTVELAPEASTNHITIIYNTTPSSDGYDVDVKDDSGATTLVSLGPDEWAVFLPVYGEGWKTWYINNPPAGQSVLSSDFTITAAVDGTFEDSGLSIAIPSAGTYLITGDVRVKIDGNAGTGWGINVKLYNSTDAADVSNSIRRAIYTLSATEEQVTCPITVPVTVTAAKTIKLYVARISDGSFTTSLIASGATTGLTSLSYFRIG